MNKIAILTFIILYITIRKINIFYIISLINYETILNFLLQF